MKLLISLLDYYPNFAQVCDEIAPSVRRDLYAFVAEFRNLCINSNIKVSDEGEWFEYLLYRRNELLRRDLSDTSTDSKVCACAHMVIYATRNGDASAKRHFS